MSTTAPPPGLVDLVRAPSTHYRWVDDPLVPRVAALSPEEMDALHGQLGELMAEDAPGTRERDRLRTVRLLITVLRHVRQAVAGRPEQRDEAANAALTLLERFPSARALDAGAVSRGVTRIVVDHDTALAAHLFAEVLHRLKDMPSTTDDALYLHLLRDNLLIEGVGGSWLDEDLLLDWLGGCFSLALPFAALPVLRRAGAARRPELVALLRRHRLDAHGTRDVTVLPEEGRWPLLNVGEAWSEAATSDIDALPEPERDALRALVAHALTATTAKPSAAWKRTARDLLSKPGAERFPALFVAWGSRVGRARTLPLRPSIWYSHDVSALLDPHNVTALRGLCWLATLCPPAEGLERVLGGMVETALRKAPGVGPRSPRLANSATYALSELDGAAALGQLARLSSRVTYKGTLKEIDKGLARRAEALGISRDEIEELGVPTFGMTEVGTLEERFDGGATARLLIGTNSATLSWTSATGRPVRSVPAQVRADHPEDVARLRGAVKDVTKMLTAQRDRLDRLMLSRRTWRYEGWRDRYLDHPLVGVLARRLVWWVGGTPACWFDGRLVDVDGAEVTADPAAEVRLWHPVEDGVERVLAWRRWLEDRRVTQPFKQAHREVYPLTDAERATGVYSNRFAAHILRQHQFHSLATVRGWRNQLRLMVDDSCEAPCRELPEWGLRAEFWVEGVGEDYGTDTTESGTFLHLATDQVRFYPLDAPRNSQHACGGPYSQWVGPDQEPTPPVPLAEVPPLVLSEVLRDVDLFVGVASVGADPTWADGGPAGRYQEYWHSYGFGELSATALTRRDLLSRVVPRLAIADRCSLDGRFLRVRGDLRSYRIHLGSGNILMEPNDEYLCIVPTRRDESSGSVFLPFDGDRTLAVILSKAFLLAADTSITDSTITSQLRR
ncbi:hypothetical protein C1701_02270 [Actinoalloteichus sp. AHMU CJ021]|uniref:DUF4132 domain-containing protein n=1 Tax=Actinoalloteichus sp. AHMU CJ021 TaxID=2072503 RepID=UPI000CA05E88|nr:hypothetical protein C1701_02270 [Actinoalloteichus sp. AHMU CJ021]